MGLRFRKSINLGGGVRLNLSKRGVGASAGVRGARYTVGPSGRYWTFSAPGTGVSYQTPRAARRRAGMPPASSCCLGAFLVLPGLLTARWRRGR